MKLIEKYLILKRLHCDCEDFKAPLISIESKQVKECFVLFHIKWPMAINLLLFTRPNVGPSLTPTNIPEQIIFIFVAVDSISKLQRILSKVYGALLDQYICNGIFCTQTEYIEVVCILMYDGWCSLNGNLVKTDK